jgi:Flp pilus assembly protein TadG
MPLRRTLLRTSWRSRGRQRGQALVEISVLGLLLGVLLAGTLDFGRAYYTSIVVSQMAGEGAAYAAWHPDRDIRYPTAGTCSQITTDDIKTIQERARLVAREHGMAIEPSQATISIQNTDGSTSLCTSRCAGTTLRVKVTYVINDLFLPNLLGFRSIKISRSATQLVMRDAYAAEGTCP